MQFISLEKREAVAVITMTRPPANALSPELVGELDQVLGRVATDTSFRAVLLRGGVKGFFAAGADITAMEKMTSEEASGLAQRYQQVFGRLEQLPVPVVACLNGHALGGGLELALACDFRLMVDDGKSVAGLPEVHLGLLPGAGGTQRLPRLIGRAKALELLMLGLRLKAPEALQAGLVHRVFFPEHMEEESFRFAQGLARQATRSLGLIKRCLYQGLELPPERGLELEAAAFAEVIQTADAKEGVAAFLSGRKAAFSGS